MCPCKLGHEPRRVKPFKEGTWQIDLELYRNKIEKK